MQMSIQKKIQHLHLRAGFGASYSVVKSGMSSGIESSADALFRSSEKYTLLRNEYADMLPPVAEMQEMSGDKRKELLMRSQKEIINLNAEWLRMMTYSESQLREKMTLFWHGHFACRTRVPLFCMGQNNTLRQHALGKFGDLLHAVSKDPAMLQFLNNQQNRKQSPNENFAREVMELFTLGRGNYSENDVKEAARAFTGWGFDREGNFRIRKRFHDDGRKVFLGASGNLTGEDILNLILEKKQTARFICTKIFRYFVSEKVDSEIVEGLSDKFFRTDYDIAILMKEIFTSSWFYDDRYIGTRIKSPAEYITGISRILNMRIQDSRRLAGLQRALGQVLFNPPNVGGWPGGRNWIDTSSLALRLRIPEQIFRESNIEFDYKLSEGDDSGDAGMKSGNRSRIRLRVSADASGIVKDFGGLRGKETVEKMAEYLLQPELSREKLEIVLKHCDESDGQDMAKSAAMRIMSLPEFQLC